MSQMAHVMVEQSAGPLCGCRQNLNTSCAFPPGPGSHEDISQGISLRLGSMWGAALTFMRKTCGEGLNGDGTPVYTTVSWLEHLMVI